MEVADAKTTRNAKKPGARKRTVESAGNADDSPPQLRYSVEIIKVGAPLLDTRIMLAHWDMNADVSANLARMQEENVFGKTSRACPACWLSSANGI